MAIDKREKTNTIALEAPYSIQGDNIGLGVNMDKMLEQSHDVDDAMKAFVGHEGEVIEIDEATNKRLLRTIDWNLLPLSTILYMPISCPHRSLIIDQCVSFMD